MNQPSFHASQPGALNHPRRGPFLGIIGSALIVWAGCLIFAGGHLYSPDEEVLYRLTEAVGRRGEWSIQPLEGFATRAGRDGREYPQYPPLQAVLAIPLDAAARLTRRFASDEAILGRVWDTTQYHDFSADSYWSRFWAAMFFNSTVTALTAAILWWMGWKIARGDRRAAWLTSLGYGFSTLALPHSRTFFTEPLAALWLMTALAALWRWNELAARAHSGEMAEKSPSRATWPLALAAGLACAAGVWTRVDFPLFLPGISLGVAWLSLRPAPGQALPSSMSSSAPPSAPSSAPLWRRVSWKPLFAFGLPLAAALAGWFLYNRLRFGGAGSTGYEDQPEGVKFATPFLVGLHGYLASPGKGLFFFSPPLLLALWGIGRLIRRGGESQENETSADCRERENMEGGASEEVRGAPEKAQPGRRLPGSPWAWAWALSTGLFFLFMCKWQNWSGGWCWGPRHIFQIHAPLMLGFAAWLTPPRKSWIRIAAICSLAAGFAIQIFGCSESFIDYYRDFFRTPEQQPSFYSLYAPDEDMLINQSYQLEARTASGNSPISASLLPAPINDSLYIPQHTQWTAYPMLWRMGRHDFFWLHMMNAGP